MFFNDGVISRPQNGQSLSSTNVGSLHGTERQYESMNIVFPQTGHRINQILFSIDLPPIRIIARNCNAVKW